MSVRLAVHNLGRVLAPPDSVSLVRKASFVVEAGEFAAIVGPSGCGKSSLLYLLGLLDRPTEGSLYFDGVDAGALTERERTHIRLERVGFVFQFHFLLPELTARENVSLPMRRLGRLNGAQAAARANSLIEMLGVRGGADKRPDRMSGGERQRVAIARALANDPSIILGDEPTGNLDSANTRIVIEEFKRLAHAEGRAVICVTHDQQVAAAADRRIRMLDGHIVADDS